MRLKVNVRIRLKPGILDPQGKAIEESLPALGYGEVESVRVGKLIQLVVEGETRESIEQRVSAMCDALLANPVIEDYELEVEPPGGDD